MLACFAFTAVSWTRLERARRVSRRPAQAQLSAAGSSSAATRYRAIAVRQSELAAKCKQQRDEWIDLMFKPRIASPPRVAAPPQVPGGPPKPKKKKGNK